MEEERGLVARGKTDIQRAAQLTGAVFLLVGAIGFIPGITSDYGDLTRFDGEGARIFGLFGATVLENVVHLAYGVVGLAAAASWANAKQYFVWGGAVYLALWLYGLLGGSEDESAANFLGLNSAADWLHFALGLGMLAVGFLVSRKVAPDRARATS